MPQHLEEEQIRLVKDGRCFSYKERDYTAYNYPKKEKIIAIFEDVSEDSNNQGKK